MQPRLPLTYLFVPGDRPERFAKALASGADRIIIDLEDAVAPADKAAARGAIAQWWASTDKATDHVLVRINDHSTPWYADDLALMGALRGVSVMLPKCEAASQVCAVLDHLQPNAMVLPLIETARGVDALQDIAAAHRVARLGFGSLDYMVDMDIPQLRDVAGKSSQGLSFAAAQIAIASRLAGIASPVAGVTPELDAAHVTADMLEARACGFGAKMCIHPAQVAAVQAALTPTAQELAWAQRVLQAWRISGGAALQVDGKMVDRPVVLKAERIVNFSLRCAPELA
jgi:citrate lyase subunit beta / citryl-CoA lyase